MKYNQYSYLSVDQKDILKELKEIGFDLPTHLPEKNCLNGLSGRFTSPIKIQIIPSLT